MKNERPLVSVFMPTFQHEKYISEAIESVIKQDYESIELVIGDDCSKDRNWEIVETYKEQYPDLIQAYRNERNLGVTANCSAVLARCRGKYIAFHSGDDIWLPNKISKQVAMMEKEENCCLIYHDLDVFDSDTGRVMYQWNSGKKRPAPIEGSSQYMREMIVEKTAGFLGALSIMIRRSALDPKVVYDTRLPHLSELTFWLQVLRRAEDTVLFIPEVLARYRKHGKSLSHTNFDIEWDIFLGIVENEYPSLIGSVRKARSRRYYSRGVQSVQSGDRVFALRYFVHSLRYGFYSPKVMYWLARSLFLTTRRGVS